VLEPDRDGLSAHIGSFDYDAAGVAREVAAAGLPHQYADKLLSASWTPPPPQL
jgi:hypothetical protein